MALKVWLPLNGSLENKGISNVTVTNNGATINNNGKIGKCYSPATCTITNIGDIVNDNITYSFWAKTSSTSSWQLVIGIDNESLNQIHGIYVADSARFKYEYNPSLNIYGAEIGQWHHYCFIIRHKKSECYYDGVLSSTSDENVTSEKIGRIRLGVGSAISLNDVRIYDHCLSPLEVKEISQGLILHYKLNDNIQILNNCYSYPTFNTSSGNGGWSHWGRSGHAGSQGQNTDKTYIYNKENTYSHWVSNGETATGEYLVYQSPAFDGGYRSLQAIIKEENSSLINEDICFPAWNARNGGAIADRWTSITSLGNGFYLCKCEGISQDGSNDLVGIYVKPGYKIYISEAYLENNKQLCSEILYPRNYVIDSSGYGNDGVVEGNITMSKDSARYNYSSYFDNNANRKCGIFVNNLTTPFDQYTISVWIKDSAAGKMSLGSNSSVSNTNTNFYLYGDNSWKYTHGGTGGEYYFTHNNPITIGNWIHYGIVYDGSKVQIYRNGTNEGSKATTGQAIFNNISLGIGYSAASYQAPSYISDFRIYATALSAEDILDLYHTSANIDNLQNIHTFEFQENGEKISIYQNGITSVTDEMHEANAELLNTVMTGGYTPAKNTVNSCTNFGYADFNGYASLGQDLAVHIECDVEWTAFTADTGGTFRGVWFQGANYEIASSSFKWAGANYICTALNSAYSLQTLSVITVAGKHHYDTITIIPASWFTSYSRSQIGWRCDYSDGTGTISIKNLKVTPSQFYNAKIGEDFISANTFIEK